MRIAISAGKILQTQHMTIIRALAYNATAFIGAFLAYVLVCLTSLLFLGYV
jgi:hypothetical protein